MRKIKTEDVEEDLLRLSTADLKGNDATKKKGIDEEAIH